MDHVRAGLTGGLVNPPAVCATLSFIRPRPQRVPAWALNHPRQSPTILPSWPCFPVFGSPKATIEVVRNTGKLSSEKAGVGGSTPSLATILFKHLATPIIFSFYGSRPTISEISSRYRLHYCRFDLFRQQLLQHPSLSFEFRWCHSTRVNIESRPHV